uniref:Uncharacterized protein n=1 Tax=Plectus sambesii TaxID=2011161 RepID=A0A914V5W5_9BILA
MIEICGYRVECRTVRQKRAEAARRVLTRAPGRRELNVAAADDDGDGEELDEGIIDRGKLRVLMVTVGHDGRRGMRAAAPTRPAGQQGRRSVALSFSVPARALFRSLCCSLYPCCSFVAIRRSMHSPRRTDEGTDGQTNGGRDGCARQTKTQHTTSDDRKPAICARAEQAFKVPKWQSDRLWAPCRLDRAGTDSDDGEGLGDDALAEYTSSHDPMTHDQRWTQRGRPPTARS